MFCHVKVVEVNPAASLLPAGSHWTSDGIKGSGTGAPPGSVAGHEATGLRCVQETRVGYKKLPCCIILDRLVVISAHPENLKHCPQSEAFLVVLISHNSAALEAAWPTTAGLNLGFGCLCCLQDVHFLRELIFFPINCPVCVTCMELMVGWVWNHLFFFVWCFSTLKKKQIH